jgi:hypothetical protein
VRITGDALRIVNDEWLVFSSIWIKINIPRVLDRDWQMISKSGGRVSLWETSWNRLILISTQFICQNWSHSLLQEAGVCSMAMSVRDRQDLEELLGLGGSKWCAFSRQMVCGPWWSPLDFPWNNFTYANVIRHSHLSLLGTYQKWFGSNFLPSTLTAAGPRYLHTSLGRWEVLCLNEGPPVPVLIYIS